MTTRSQTGNLKPRSFSDYYLFFSTKHPFHAIVSIQILVEPTCYSHASLSPAWRAAMGDEIL
jgi:hypothetical protein